MSEQQTYKRRTFLIIPRFQLRFSFYVVTWIGVLFLAYPMTIYETFEWFARYLSSIPNGPAPDVVLSYQKNILRNVVIFHGSLTIFVFLLSIFLSHRIAGPVYRIRKAMHALRTGAFETVQLRSSDHFLELASDFNALSDAFKVKFEQTEKQLSDLASSTKDPQLKAKLAEISKCLREPTLG